jgi:type VI secretion system protein VasD
LRNSRLQLREETIMESLRIMSVSETPLFVLARRIMVGCTCAGILAIGLSACASKPVESRLQVGVSTTADVNPDARNRASPVTVRVYALKSAAAFESADFFSLYEKDAATLGQDVVRREELLLRPGETKPLEMTLPPDAKVIAVFAAFRDLEHARWRAIRPIEPGKPANIQIQLSARQITIN